MVSKEKSRYMKKLNHIGMLLALVFALAGLTGCEPAAKPSPAKPASGEGHDHDHDHDHDHEHEDHAHAMGPQGGHVVKFADNKGFAAWDHKDNEDKVIVYLLSDDYKQLQGRKVTKAYFVATSGDQRKEFELTATDANAEGVASTFERVDKALLAATHLGTELIVETADGELRVKIEPHHH
jgi:ABC-type Zn2+ transport system substrate-binding protein/surface adhesin